VVNGYAKSSTTQNYKKQSLKIGEMDAIRIEYTSTLKNEFADLTGYLYIIYVAKAESGNLIITYSRDPKWKDYSKVFELMVSTFKPHG
jgi:hypothetical protein